MKKILISLFVIITLFFIAVYLFLPARATFSNSISIKANPSATTRIVRDDNWKRWWPGIQSNMKDSIFEFKKYAFIIKDRTLKSIEVEIRNKEDRFNTALNIIPLSLDSVKLDWVGTGEYTNSPFRRIEQSIFSKNIQRDVHGLLDSLKLYLQEQQNTYGIKIVEEKVKDTLLITTRSDFNTYPSVASVYEMIRLLRDYAKKNGISEMNYPMLHVRNLGDGKYSTMVAIPVNREMPGEKDIAYKRMAPGKILVTEVKGGPHSIQATYAQYENYLNDYHRIAPAIPFESLVTERIAEPDTSKWITRIYYPVF